MFGIISQVFDKCAEREGREGGRGREGVTRETILYVSPNLWDGAMVRHKRVR